jgi:hypothetical protein
MKVNNQEITAKSFAFDGCHKIYLCDSSEEERDAAETGYDIFPIEELQAAYEGSCGLRFINNWALDKSYVSQFEQAVFTND